MAKSNAAPGGIVSRVTELALPITEACGVILWDVRFLKEGATWILRIVIDREDDSVSINDCVDVSRSLSTRLDEVDPIPQSYCLEVTSPGADRELTRPEHFTYYIDLPVNIKLYRPDETGQREIAGLLREYRADGSILLELEDGSRKSFEKKEMAAVHAIDDFDNGPDNGFT